MLRHSKTVIFPIVWPGIRRLSHFLNPLLVAASLTASALPAPCCSVPVFRYALDHWNADRFRLEIAHSDFSSEPLADSLRKLIGDSSLNLEAERALQANAPSRLFAPSRTPSTPPSPNGRTPLWEGSLNPNTLHSLLHSKARESVTRQILEGNSMVWILVETGLPKEDEPARMLLEQRLRFLEQVSELPPIDPSDPSNKIGPGPKLAIKLGSLRISRNDPNETLFLKMLAGPNGLEALPTEKPFVAVVFGRGRVLGTWSDPDESTIEEASRFLMGACSCQVKNQNPGWDLLTPVDWDESLRNADLKRSDSLDSPAGSNFENTAPSTKADPQPETVIFESSQKTNDENQSIDLSRAASRISKNQLAAALAAIGLLLAVASRISKGQ